MAHSGEIKNYLPLSETTYYIMLSLAAPLHGYAVMQAVEEISQGTVKLGPGTLYGVLSTLEKDSLIVKTKEEERRKYYTLTPKGKLVLKGQVQRLEIMTRSGLNVVEQL